MKRSLLIVTVIMLFLALGMNAWTTPLQYSLLREMSGGYEYSLHARVPSPQFRLSGTVVGCDGEPIPGAIIQVTPGGYTIVTDANGEFSLCCLTAGIYQVKCSSVGLGGATVSVTMDRDQQVHFVLCCG